MRLPGASTRADFRHSPEYHAAAYLRPQVAANLAAPTRNRPRAAGQTDAGSDRFRLTAVSRESLANDCGRRYLTLADLPDGCLVYLGTGPSLAAGPAAGSAPRRRCPANDCCRWRRTGPFDPQLPMTETAWASEMQRKAAGHLRAVSENQSHKIRCRSAVGRVGRQSTPMHMSQLCTRDATLMARRQHRRGIQRDGQSLNWT